MTMSTMIDSYDPAYQQGVIDERKRCVALCEGLALAYDMGGYGQPPEVRDNIRHAALWLRDEIKKGKLSYE